MKKLLAVLLVCVLLFEVLPLNAAIAETQYVTVTKADTAVRDTYYEVGNVLFRVNYGTALKVLTSTTNKYDNLWYKIEYKGRTGWIWSGNVTNHKHNYYRVNYNGNTFAICQGCMTISIEKVTTITVSQANSVALAIPAAAGASAIDGPFPVGDLVGLFILVVAVVEMGGTPTQTLVREMVETMDLEDFARGNNQCGIESFYKVRINQATDKLDKKDHDCLNVFQAFVCARFLNTNVWTRTREQALLCASLNGNRYFSERDSNKPTHYWHYHLGRNHNDMDASTHIFYGTDDYGNTPR